MKNEFKMMSKEHVICRRVGFVSCYLPGGNGKKHGNLVTIRGQWTGMRTRKPTKYGVEILCTV